MRKREEGEARVGLDAELLGVQEEEARVKWETAAAVGKAAETAGTEVPGSKEDDEEEAAGLAAMFGCEKSRDSDSGDSEAPT